VDPPRRLDHHRRELGHIRRDPGQLIAAVTFPAAMVLLFGYVFGSAIAVPGGGNYREYLMPGLFAMAAVAGVMVSALLISKDVAEGLWTASARCQPRVPRCPSAGPPPTC
jgi:hypothetical protein